MGALSRPDENSSTTTTSPGGGEQSGPAGLSALRLGVEPQGVEREAQAGLWYPQVLLMQPGGYTRIRGGAARRTVGSTEHERSSPRHQAGDWIPRPHAVDSERSV
jgi:hypothetical protein